MKALTRIAAGTWIAPGDVRSVVAFGEERYEDTVMEKARVVLHTSRTELTWSFETIEAAQAFAGTIAAICNGPDADGEAQGAQVDE